MAKTPSTTNTHDTKKPAAKQVRAKKLLVTDAEIGEFKAGSGPMGPDPQTPSPTA